MVAGQRRSEILVIEDDDQVRDAIRALLESEGYSVLAASNGKDALERLNRIHPPALILLDLLMPIMSGQEFLAELIKEDAITFSKIPIVVITGASGDKWIESVKPFTAVSLRKPVDVDALLGIVAQYVSV